jgi:hypothetical protein
MNDHQTIPPPQDRPLAGHGVIRGHAVVAVQILRNRVAEPWTLNALAAEVHLMELTGARWN